MTKLGNIKYVGSTPAGDPFGTDPSWLPLVEVPIPRQDGTDKPLIVPPGGTEPVAYERVSTVAKIVDGAGFLVDWKLGMLARGMALSPDLLEMAAMIKWNSPEMKSIVNTAHDRAGGNRKANWGTAVHLAQQNEVPLEAIPDLMEQDVRAIRLLHERLGIEIRGTELFVVNDELRTAGTFDTRAYSPVYDLHIRDYKTGKIEWIPWAIQTGIYANSYLVDISLLAEGKFAPRIPLGVNTDVAVIDHVPREMSAARPKPVNIARGYEVAKQIVAMMPALSAADWFYPEDEGVKRKDVIDHAIATAVCKEDILNVQRQCTRYWTKAQAEAARVKWREIVATGLG